MTIDIIVVLINLLVFRELEIGLYSFIVIWIIGKIIDIIFEGINYCKIVWLNLLNKQYYIFPEEKQ